MFHVKHHFPMQKLAKTTSSTSSAPILPPHPVEGPGRQPHAFSRQLGLVQVRQGSVLMIARDRESGPMTLPGHRRKLTRNIKADAIGDAFADGACAARREQGEDETLRSALRGRAPRRQRQRPLANLSCSPGRGRSDATNQQPRQAPVESDPSTSHRAHIGPFSPGARLTPSASMASSALLRPAISARTTP